ncbi:MAG TPA: plastocyanin/azurin family copper-binding protein [Solirubrobacteraceae bacterium]|jgi:plastocyanin|nr:plastocyanin/azurin family copper-binding protein [Solirubrobacteraceae bacterium]
MKRLLIMLVACTALVAAGCGGDDNSSSSSGSSSATKKEDNSGSGSGAATTSDTVEIDMKNFQFVPKDQTVKVGQKVKWVNQDSAPHDATDEKTGQFKSGQFAKGESFEFTPKKAGKISYVCTIHPGMDGTLTVTQ